MLWLLYMLVAYHAIQSHAAAHEEPAALSIEEVGQATIYSISADGIIRLDNY
jgi:hypothetical protein